MGSRGVSSFGWAERDWGATASRTPRRASKRERARESMLSWTAVMGSIFVQYSSVMVGGVELVILGWREESRAPDFWREHHSNH